HRRWCPVRLVMGSRGSVSHACSAFGRVPIGPLLRGLPRHVIALGRAGRWPAVVDDQASEPQSSAWRQRSVGMGSVGHEDLLDVERFLDSSTPHREVFTSPELQIVSSHDLDQRAWASHLGVLSPSWGTDGHEVPTECVASLPPFARARTSPRRSSDSSTRSRSPSPRARRQVRFAGSAQARDRWPSEDALRRQGRGRRSHTPARRAGGRHLDQEGPELVEEHGQVVLDGDLCCR
ncbi:hypothetical protein SAMN05192575_107225, partial [Nocardioides alpinus]